MRVVRVVLIALAVLWASPLSASAQTAKPCAVVMVASTADAVASWNAVHAGRAVEANPLLSDAIQWRSRSAFVGLKLLMTAPVCMVIDNQKRPRDRWISASAAAVFYALLAVKAHRVGR